MSANRTPPGAATAPMACPVATIAAQTERVLAARAEIERLDAGQMTITDRVQARADDDLLCAHQQRLVERVLTTKATSLAGAAAQLPIATAFVEELYDLADDTPRAREIIGMLRLALYSISAVVHVEAYLLPAARLPEYFMPAQNDPHEMLASALAHSPSVSR